MAASIYATPPPDLSSEDTALSDVSNASSLNNHNRSNTNKSSSDEATTAATATMKHQKRSIADVIIGNPSPKPEREQRHALELEQHQRQEKEQEQLHQLNSISTDADMEGSNTAASNAAALTETSAHMTVAQNTSAAMAAVAAAANAAMQLQLLEAINDAAKKRRKQHNPSRLGVLNLSGTAGENIDDASGMNEAAEEGAADDDEAASQMEASAISIDYEEKLSKMFLPKSMEQLKETFELLQQQQQHFQQEHGDGDGEGEEEQQETQASEPQLLDNISNPTHATNNRKATNAKQKTDESVAVAAIQEQQQTADEDELRNPYQTFCKQCGENFETEFKLGLHMLQEHGDNNEEGENTHAVDAHRKGEMTPFDILSSVKVKLERPDYDSPLSPQSSAVVGIHGEQPSLLASGKEQWMSGMPGVAFPFAPEAAAAAALSAGGYLPLLGVPGFPSVDGLNRPPLRIFNPEAYCDLCNKEFCNKYFLKTHKANKHGIYDPATPSSAEGGSNSSNLTAMNHMFQLQMQQQQQLQLQQQKQQQLNLEYQQQQQAQPIAEAPRKQAAQQALSIPQQVTPPAPPPVYCDICSKRFTNVFAMRRHRAKAHEQAAAQRSSPHESKQEASPTNLDSKLETGHCAASSDASSKQQFQMPEGFRQDFTLEQEEVSFTPQPRKLSPQSQQQAREANFAHDKLKRLGVHSPEAFCEICCKEYCNKYFLRTHKWKRHGIFVPPDDLKDEQLALAQKMSWPFMSMPGMPLNLMMANEKAVVAQRMLAAAAAASNVQEDTGPMLKRIKLEMQEEDEYKMNEENPTADSFVDRSGDGGGGGGGGGVADQQTHHMANITSTSEPQNMPSESLESSASIVASPEAAMGLQNLQKLQSMIQQLNDLNGKRPVSCHLCGRELENQYALHAHMMAEHSGAVDTGSSMMPLNFQQHILQQQQALKLSPSDSNASVSAQSDLRCNQCDRDFPTLPEFKQHIAEVHLLSDSPLRDGFITPERPTNPNPVGTSRPPYTITPTSSYCEICNKELCNKYFMKTHMQRMHGIEIENGAQIGGVVCNICNKELCSKYFLRVHKHNTHGIVEEGAPLPQPRQNGINLEAQQQQQQQQQQQPQPQTLIENDLGRSLNVSPFGIGAGASGEAKADASDARYYANYTEVCPICARRFRSPKWLRAHLLSDHGTAGVEKLREMEQQLGAGSKPASPTLKIPNGSGSGAGAVGVGVNSTGMGHNPTNLAQALQNLNAQHLLSNMPKNVLPGMFGPVADQALQSPRFKEYQCSLCPFTTPYYAFLFIHERSHSILNNSVDPPVSEAPNLANTDNGQDSMRNGKEKGDNAISLGRDKSKQLQMDETISYFTGKANNSEPTNLSTRTTTPTEKPAKRTNESTAQRAPKEVPRSTTTASTTDAKVEKVRSIATSPIFSSNNAIPQDMLKDFANKSKKPISYAIPKDTSDLGEHHMQAFMVKAVADTSSHDERSSNMNRFVPAIIYLPVKERVSDPITVTFNLTPA